MKLMPTVSQGVPATKAFYSLNKVQKPQGPTNAVEGAAEGASVPAATGGGAQSLPGEIDLQAFFAAWGTDNAQFDVTKDGTVDGQDLAMFLGSAEGPLNGQASPNQVIGSWGNPAGGGDVNGDGVVDGFDLALSLGNVDAPAKETALADGVQKAWGTDNDEYDLNGDGTVDGSDLAIALGGNNATQDLNASSGSATDDTAAAESATQQASQQMGEAATKLTDAVLQTKDGNGDGELTAVELGTATELLAGADVDASQSISRDELQSTLTSMLGNAASKSSADFSTITSKWAQALLRTDSKGLQARSAYAKGASPLADRLYEKLAAGGFSQSPPSNIMKLVQGLTSNDSQRASVLRGLANRYPNGLGVSATA